MTSAIVACRNHPAREAIGVCVSCRARVCGECSTKVEGINRCVECLAKLAGEGAPSAPRAETGAAGGRVAAAAALGTISLLAWALLELALPR